jgi:hypothetical protein
MTIEDAIERYQFTCRRCATQWAADYDARHVTDVAGNIFSFYRRDGVPCEAPAAADIMCPTCHRAPVHVILLAYLPIPGTGD